MCVRERESNNLQGVPDLHSKEVALRVSPVHGLRFKYSRRPGGRPMNGEVTRYALTRTHFKASFATASNARKISPDQFNDKVDLQSHLVRQHGASYLGRHYTGHMGPKPAYPVKRIF